MGVPGALGPTAAFWLQNRDLTRRLKKINFFKKKGFFLKEKRKQEEKWEAHCRWAAAHSGS
jgi:hypothetical protein